MAARSVLLLGVSSLSTELAVGIRSSAREGGDALVVANASTSACYDTDGGNVDGRGLGCESYDSYECGYADHYITESFNARTMCCACGGGSASAQQQDNCPQDCFGGTCEDWMSRYTCETLQTEYKCNCQGCTRCNDASPPKFVYLGEGDCVFEDGSSPHYIAHSAWDDIQCQRKCDSSPECIGFSSTGHNCHIFDTPGTLVASYAQEEGTQTYCWAKTESASPKQVSDGGHRPEDLEEGDEQEADDDSEKEERLVASESTQTLPVLGLKNEDLAQTFRFSNNAAGYGMSMFKLDSSFHPMEECKDAKPDVCAGQADIEVACKEQPELRDQCMKSCGVCETRQEDNLNAMYLISQQEDSLLGAQRVVFADEQGALKSYTILRPGLMARRDSWRVVNSAGKVAFTIQKRKRGADCRYLFFDCKSVWKIYQGNKKTGLLRFYGIQHERSFKFYPSREDFEKDNVKWLASFKKTLPTDANKHSSFQVTVQPGQDAALMLLAAYAVNNAGDMVELEDQEDKDKKTKTDDKKTKKDGKKTKEKK